MIILLPSYKRTSILSLVIDSILLCETDGIEERICIVIVNNYYPNKSIIEDIVSEKSFRGQFSYKIIHREVTLPAVESWFAAIFESAAENEVVFLHGDDDLMLPWGLKNRFQAISSTNADMLISDFYQRVYFSDDGKQYALISDEPICRITDSRLTEWQFCANHHPRASFISNHCFRNTSLLKSAFETAILWSKTQDWVPYAFATGSLPLYMSFAVHHCGGKVVDLSTKCVLRGALVSETTSREYADGCSTAFYSLLLYQIFNSCKVHEDAYIIDSHKKIYLESIRANIISLLIDRPTSWSVIRETLDRSELDLRQIVKPSHFIRGSVMACLKKIPGMRGFRVKKAIKQNSGYLISDFMRRCAFDHNN